MPKVTGNNRRFYDLYFLCVLCFLYSLTLTSRYKQKGKMSHARCPLCEEARMYEMMPIRARQRKQAQASQEKRLRVPAPMLRKGEKSHARCLLCRQTYKKVYVYEYTRYTSTSTRFDTVFWHLILQDCAHHKSTHRAPTVRVPRAIDLHTQ